MRCKADGNGLVYSSPDQVSDDACTQDRRADNRGRDSGVEGAADDVLDGCLLEMDAPSDEKSCLGGDLSFDEFELRDGPEGGFSAVATIATAVARARCLSIPAATRFAMTAFLNAADPSALGMIDAPRMALKLRSMAAAACWTAASATRLSWEATRTSSRW